MGVDGQQGRVRDFAVRGYDTCSLEGHARMVLQ